jgi:hypothetical protein
MRDVLASSVWPAHFADLKIPQMKTVSLRSNPLKAAFAGVLLSATLINAGDVKAISCSLNALSTCVFNDGFYKVDNITITPSSGWNFDLTNLQFDLMNITNSPAAANGVLAVNVSFNPIKSVLSGATLTYDLMKLSGNPLLQAQTNSNVGNVPSIGTGTTSVLSSITGLNGGTLLSSNGGIDSDMFTVPLTSTSVSTVFSSTGPATFTSFNVEFTSGAPVPPPSLVPGPLPLLGAGAAFGFSRRLRRRINTSATA